MANWWEEKSWEKYPITGLTSVGQEGSNPSVYDPLQEPSYSSKAVSSIASSPFKSGAGAIGSVLGGIVTGGNPLGAIVGGALGEGGGSLIDYFANKHAESEYSKQEQRNRDLAERLYQQQRADEQEQKQYSRGVYATEWQYRKQQDKQALDWAEKQDKYKKYLDQVMNFTNFMNTDSQMRANLINVWRTNRG